MCTAPGFLTARSFVLRMSSLRPGVLPFPSSGRRSGWALISSGTLLFPHLIPPARAPTPASKVQDAHQRLAIEAAPAALLQRSNAGLNTPGGVGPATADCHLTSAGGSWWLANGTGTYLLCTEVMTPPHLFGHIHTAFEPMHAAQRAASGIGGRPWRTRL